MEPEGRKRKEQRRLECQQALRPMMKALAEETNPKARRDGRGFNSADAPWGRRIAMRSQGGWTDEELWKAYQLLEKYERQLREYGFDYSSAPSPPGENPYAEAGHDSSEQASEGPKAAGGSRPRQFGYDKPEEKPEEDSRQTGAFLLSYEREDPDFYQMLKKVRALPKRHFQEEQERWRIPATQANASMLRPIVEQFFGEGRAARSARAVRRLSTLASKEQHIGIVENEHGFLSFSLRFPYHEKLIEHVAQISYSNWNGAEGCWELPVRRQAVTLVEKLIQEEGGLPQEDGGHDKPGHEGGAFLRKLDLKPFGGSPEARKLVNLAKYARERTGH